MIIEATQRDAEDLSTMRVPGLPPAEEPETTNLYTWGSTEPAKTIHQYPV